MNEIVEEECELGGDLIGIIMDYAAPKEVQIARSWCDHGQIWEAAIGARTWADEEIAESSDSEFESFD